MLSGVKKTNQDSQSKPGFVNRAVGQAVGSSAEIAVIGIACRFPGAGEKETFWRNLIDGVDGVSEVPAERWDWQSHWGDPKTEENCTNSRWGGFIDDVDKFDPGFFGISAREAELMDPQQRVMLELSWACFEDAGIRPSTLSGKRVGVSIGVFNFDYKELIERSEQPVAAHHSTGTAPTIIPNRISYFFNFRGPSAPVDTACSSGLYAIHQAMQWLREGECELALAGGVNVLLTPTRHISFAKTGMLSPTGRCRSFDESADGYVRGEGAAVLLLKPLQQAIDQGDRIYGIIKGSAINHGGKAHTLTYPNDASQAEVIFKAASQAGCAANTIGYIEAHGTGTPKGDPIELQGLKTAFENLAQLHDEKPETGYCALGSVKSSIGHLEAAAGLAGVIKILMAMKYKTLPGLKHFNALNPRIDLTESPFYIAKETQAWMPLKDRQGRAVPRRAGVSSFGFGGTNAHVVIEEYPADPEPAEQTSTAPQLIVLSAQNSDRLNDVVGQLLEYLRRHCPPLADLAYTLQIGRDAMEERLAIVADDHAHLVQQLRAYRSEDHDSRRGYRGSAKQHKDFQSLFGDDELNDTLRRWLAQGKLAKLADLWCKGIDIDWPCLHSGPTPRRIDLPTYPFARERYWLSEPTPTTVDAPATATSGGKLLYSHFYWQDAPLGDSTPADSPDLAPIIIQSGADPQFSAALERVFPGATINILPAVTKPDGQGLLERFRQAFSLIQTALTDRPRQLPRLLIVGSATSPGYAHSGLISLLKTAHRENPNVRGQYLQCPAADVDRLAALIQQEQRHSWPGVEVVRYHNGQRQRQQLREIQLPATTDNAFIKPHGVYWITGGLGGLGQHFVRHLGRHRGVTIILSGRRPADDVESDLRRLRDGNLNVHYYQGDISRRGDIDRIVAAINECHGPLNGLIHSAGLIRDAYIIKKRPGDIADVFAPKVTGLIELDRATQDQPLDVVVLFSSIASVLGNVGQADYAAANAFLDSYADYRTRQVKAGHGSGATVAINWPLWRDGGMRIDEESERLMTQMSGALPMATASGLSAFDRMLSAAYDGASLTGVLVTEGDVDSMRAKLFQPQQPMPTAAVTQQTLEGTVDETLLRTKVLTELKSVFASVTKISASRLDGDEALEAYGIDSIIVTQMNNRLAEIFGEQTLSKTLLFEYQTLAQLADYLFNGHKAECACWTGLQRGYQAPAVDEAATMPASEIARPVLPPPAPAALQSKPAAISQRPVSGQDAIAIVGLACRFPGADNKEQFWDNLKAGKDCIGEVPLERWRTSVDEFFIGDRQRAAAEGKSYCTRGGFIDDFDAFDALFFNIAPRDAMTMDPQERMFLQTCWEALEDAGYTRDRLSRESDNVGVFAGVTKTGFELWSSEFWKEGKSVYPHTSFSSLANRVSYFLDLQGPSLPVDTMCSASLTAIHEACQHINRGECGVAIVGGVNLYLHPSNYVKLCQSQMLSDDGKCRSFGEGGNGFVPAEGVGVVVLKPLRQAQRDNDSIYGIVRGTAINHGGKTNGYTVPNPVAQANLIKNALADAGVDSRAISYIEAHGTGTSLGDPIEIAGLTHAFRAHTNDVQYCAIGSVKSNIGHCESAAGIAGLAKVLLQMKHQTLVPSLHARSLNKNIDFQKTPFVVQQNCEQWRRPRLPANGVERESPRIAGISSFGAGGSNAHIIVEEYIPGDTAPGGQRAGLENTPVIVPVSAKSEAALKAYAGKILAFLKQRADGRRVEARDGFSAWLERRLVDLAAALIQVDHADVDVNGCFEEQNLDITTLAQIGERLRDGFECGITHKEIIDCGSLRGLVEYLVAHYRHAFAAHYASVDEASAQDAMDGSQSVAAVTGDLGAGVKLCNIAHTFQLGREAMDYRVAFVVDSETAFIAKLEAFIAGDTEIEECYRGYSKRDREALALFAKDEDTSALVHAWIQKRKLSKLAELWSKGLEVVWQGLYGDTPPRCISLPTYPFARERYWIPEGARAAAVGKDGGVATVTATVLHPLLHSNTSTLAAQQFTSVFDGSEFVLHDHRVHGQAVLPGAAQLEMARAAGQYAAERPVHQLTDIVWAQPIRAAGSIEVTVSLLPDSGHINYEISTAADSGYTVHSQGKLITEPPVHRPAALDLARIRARLDGYHSAEACYQYFAAQGLNYGPAFQLIDALHCNAGEALAELRLPASVPRQAYRLHPSLLDAALQTTVGPSLAARTSGEPRLPFSLKSLTVYGDLPDSVFAHAVRSDGAGIAKYDITITNVQGEILVHLHEFTVLASKVGVAADSRKVIYGRPHWLNASLGNSAAADSPALVPLIIQSSADAQLGTALARACPDAVISVLPTVSQPDGHILLERFRQAFSLIQTALVDTPRRLPPLLIVSPATSPGYAHSGLISLLKTAHSENPNVRGKYLQCPAGDAEALAKLIQQEQGQIGPGVEVIRYYKGQRQRQQLREIQLPAATDSASIKPNGVYWITGGLGGLGQHLARHLGRHSGVTLILSGRRSAAEVETDLQRLRQGGLNVHYYQGDISQRSDIDRIVTDINHHHGPLNGLIHSAGLIRDAYIVKKRPEEIVSVFAPKVSGLIALDRATQEQPLDFLVLYSSIASVLGNLGQADYAAANAFLDSYADYRAKQVNAGHGSGVTVAINWPLWRDGGMRIDEESERLMKQMFGMVPLETAQGLAAFDAALAAGDGQAVVAAGDRNKILAVWQGRQPLASQAVETSHTEASIAHDASHDVLAQLSNELITITAQLLEIKPELIDLDTEMNEYGFDSISLTAFANKLNAAYDLSLMPTVFFEHPTLKSLASHLIDHHGGQLARRHPAPAAVQQADSEQTALHAGHNGTESQPPVLSSLTSKRQRFINTSSPEATESRQTDPIAIVGISGRLPGSDDLDDFWRHLENNDDLITEVPSSRWSWRDYWGDPATEGDKTFSKWGGFIDDIDKFDGRFFGISPREADLMDPQQRIFLEAVWRCLEDAGYTPDDFAGTNTGVFVGVATTDYQELIKQSGLEINAQIGTGLSHSILANRISYLLNIHGPSQPIDTACSSSLVAIHRAVECIRNGSCDMAFAGGVNALLSPRLTISFSKAGMLSRDGRCNTFDARANGYVRGEGVGVVLLKKLSRAVANGDHIYGLIRATAENHGGKANSLTAPNPRAQQALLVQAYTQAGVAPDTIGYIEAHGTGTELGDPIEINALNAAFGVLYDNHGRPVKAHHCGIGSVKTNIGHLETAAGVAGVLKVLLAMKHCKIPGNARLQHANPYLQLDGSSFYLVRQTTEWAAVHDIDGRELPRRAGVSSFGFGGVNAHVVLEEYIDERPTAVEPGSPELIVLSAASEDQLKTLAGDMVDWLRRSADAVPLRDIAYTLQVGRTAMMHRLAIVADSPGVLLERLGGYLSRAPEAAGCYVGRVDEASSSAGRRAVAADSPSLDELARDWVQGAQPDWNLLHAHDTPHRVSLPGYRFARKRHWFDRHCSADQAAERQVPATVPESVPQRPEVTLDSLDQGTIPAHTTTGKIRLVGLNDVVPASPALPRETPKLQLQSLNPGSSLGAVESEEMDMDQKVAGADAHMGNSGTNTPDAAQASVVSKQLAELLAGILYMDAPEFEQQRKFVDLGVDSIIGVEFSKAINRHFNVNISATSIYDHPTVQALSLHVAQLLGGESSQGDCGKVRRSSEHTPQHGTPETQAGRGVDEASILAMLRGQLSQVLYMDADDIAEQDKFVDAGVDSIIGVEWTKAINREFKINIPATTIYDHPTLRQLARHIAGLNADTTRSKTVAAVEPAAHERPSAQMRQCQNAAGADVAAIEAVLQRQLTRVLYMDDAEVGPNDKFVDVGVDSIIGVEWTKAINREFNLNIPATTIYDYPTLKQLAAHLAESVGVQPHSSSVSSDTPPAVPAKAAAPNKTVTATIAPLAEPQKRPVIPADYGLVVATVHDEGLDRLSPWQVAEPAAGEVQLAVCASSLNFPDSLCVKGLYPTMPAYPFVPGFEVAGVVTAVGSGVDHLREGDEVIALTGRQMGGHAKHVNVPAQLAVRKPANISFEDACSLPVIFLTVYHAYSLAALRPREHVLIQTASGGCGLMAIQLANLQRAVIYGTSSKPEKLSFLENIGVDHAIDYRDALDTRIRDLTGGRGVDVVLNMLAGDAMQQGLDVLAPNGRYLELAVQALKSSARLDLSRLVDNQAFYSIDCRRLAMRQPERVGAYLNQMVAMVEAGSIKPVVTRIYPLAAIHDAMAYVGSGQHMGKVVISHRLEQMSDMTEQCTANMREQRRHAADQVDGHEDKVVPLVNVGAKRHGAVGHAKNCEVAVIGMAGRFPKAGDIDEYWENIVNGVNGVTEVPAGRWSLERYFDEDPAAPGKTYSKWLGAVDDVDKFDASFFNISPREAELMDPQQRLFLQEAWRAIEDAGYAPGQLSGSRCGVYVGAGQGDYCSLVRDSGQPPSAYTLMGANTSILASRLSYVLNLTGASVSLDTACSSSLVAIHEAYQSILAGHNDLALAGGVNILTTPQMHILTSKSNMLSKYGACKTFDNHADGFALGEGVGVIVLKRLDAAIRDNDHIYGVIKGSGINQDGATNGITAPSIKSQTRLELDVYREYGINPEQIQLVEAHGTGTKLGDPIEMGALTAAFQQFTDQQGYCAIGSAKTQIGHTLTAAGVASVIKVLMALRHRQLPPSLHFEQANEHIDFGGSPFYVNTELKGWAVQPGTPRQAAVSAFGFSGTNAHLVIGEYRANAEIPVGADKGPQIIVFSAKSVDRLAAMTTAYERFLLASSGKAAAPSLRDMAYTLQVGRDAMAERLALVVDSVDALIGKLRDHNAGRDVVEGCYRGSVETSGTGGQVPALSAAGENRIEAGDMHALAGAWVQGATVDWPALHGEPSPRRVSLPAYPFAPERYWVPEDEQPSTPQQPVAVNELQSSAESHDILLYREQWQELPLPQDEEVASSWPVQVIVFSDLDDDAVALTAHLRKQHGSAPGVIQVGQGRTFEKVSNHHYVLPWSGEAAYEQLFQNIVPSSPGPLAVICRWHDLRGTDGIQSVYTLLKAVQRQGRHVRQLILVAGDAPHAGAWTGFRQSLGLLLPELKITLVYDDEGALAIDRLWAEGLTPGIVRYQRGVRHGLSQARSEASEDGAPPLERGGVYLITGGCGGLGEIFATHLAAKYQARLALLGRRAADDRIDALERALKTQGAQEVAYFAADVSDERATSRVIDEIEERFGRLDGVIHAAGIARAKPFYEKTWREFEATLDPKIAGTVNLDKATAHLDLKFMCCFSSLSAVLGDFGACDYAVGNRFQMEYGRYRAQLRDRGARSGLTCVINWPLWREGGLTLHGADETALYLNSSGQRFLQRDEGLDVWERLLRSQDGQWLVLAGQRRRAEQFLARAYGGESSAVSPPVQAASVPHPVAQPVPARSADSGALATRVSDDIQDAIVRVLKVKRDQLDDDVNVSDYGFDSISLTELSRDLSQHYGFDISPAVFFSHGTIAKLRDHFLTLYGSILEDFYFGDEGGDAHQPAVTEQGQPVAFVPGVSDTDEQHGLRGLRHDGGDEPVAIVGVSGRFPGADNAEQLWDVLAASRNVITEVPAERWNWRDYFSAPGHDDNRITTNMGAFVNGMTEFDPLFFGISPLEAEMIDPKQRLLLQESWRAFEDAGYSAGALRGSACGVFIGVEDGEYGRFYPDNDSSLVTGTHNGILAARISYVLNLRGPSLAINTACSSGLVALHYACQSLRNGDCDMALAGGVNLLLSAEVYQNLSQLGMLSPYGKCFTFDERADGIVPGEAVAVVVLKPLSKAIRDNDRVYGVVKGSGVNYDGKTNGITAPSGVSQEELISQVHRRHGIDVGDIDYFIAHGTGTRLGDPIEVNALMDVFKAQTAKRHYCALTSLKTNFGHTFAASGIVSLIGMVMAMKHQKIPATLNYQRLNPFIQFDDGPFYINEKIRPWLKAAGERRLGAISAFGMSGTNAHVVIEEYPTDAAPAEHAATAPQLVVLSAQNSDRLNDAVDRLIHHLNDHRPALAELAYTLQVGRDAMEERLALVADDHDHLLEQLRAYQSTGQDNPPEFRGSAKQHKDIQSLFGDDDLHATLERWLAEGKLAKLAELWSKGIDIDWPRLHSGQTPRRIGLPTYPFAREHYWLSEPARVDIVKPASAGQLLYSRPHWQDAALGDPETDAAQNIAPLIIQGSADPQLSDALERVLPGATIRVLPAITEPDGQGLLERYRQAFNLIQDRLANSPRQLPPFFIVSPATSPGYAHSGLISLLKTAHRENPNVRGKYLQCPASDAEALAKLIQQEQRQIGPGIEIIRHHNGQRQRQQLREIQLPATTDNAFIKPHGVYWITGGLGGLGQHFARHLGRHRGVTIILSGRRPGADVERDLQRLRDENLNVHYYQGDISRRGDIDRIVAAINERHGPLNGLIHSAGVIRDAYIIKKRPGDIADVFAPKVTGLIELDRATQDQPLDVVVLFSSIASVLGNVGQADYAAANAFLDSYADYRDMRVKAGHGSGATVAINWPLWRDGGMRIDEESERLMAQMFGMVPLDTAQGLEAFDAALAAGDGQVIVAAGEHAAMREKLLGSMLGDSNPRATVAVPSRNVEMSTGREVSHDQAVDYLKSTLATTLKLSPDRIDAYAALEKYGIDSIMVTRLTTQLEKEFGTLSKTLFFEYQTIAELARYFLDEHAAELTQLLVAAEAVDGTQIAEVSSSAGPSSQDTGTRVSPSHGASPLVQHDSSEADDHAVAIIGLSGRYPKAQNIEEFWDNLSAGRDCIEEVPAERWDHRKYYDPDKTKAGKTYGKWGGFISDVDKFDPYFFNISPREAELMDPQERLFLEVVWETLEDAGYTRERLTASGDSGLNDVGVYVGVMYEEYQLYGAEQTLQGNVISLSGNPASIANRISYFCNFHGPSIAIDTMCSSSLTAIHLACESLRNSSCGVAIAGGVNVSIHPNKYIALGQGKFISSKGRCESFGEGGEGYVPGEGVGAVLLKPLRKAIADQDRIYGVIRATAVNHGGKTNGYTVPNPKAQAAVIKQALEKERIDPRAISYIEAHGTGTRLGDPIEITGLTRAFQAFTPDTQYCAIGSAKSNIGHCESAAGIAGVTKVLLQMKHRQLAPSLHAGTLNPNIDFSKTPFFVQRQRADWQRPVIDRDGVRQAVPRLAGVSSFGAGGSNAHVIIEEYLPDDASHASPAQRPPGSPVIIPLSAKKPEGLRAYAQKLADAITGHEPAPRATQELANRLTHDVIVMLSALIDVDQAEIDAEAAWDELGVDTLILNQLRQRLHQRFALDIELSTFDPGQSVASLVGDLVALHRQALTVHFAGDMSGAHSDAVRQELEDLAYTLQVGREAMEYRAVLVVNSLQELKERLTAFGHSDQEVPGVLTGQVKALAGDNDFATSQTVLDEVLDGGTDSTAYQRIAELWVAGVSVDWERLYGDVKPRRIGLPTYPFARKRYWVPGAPQTVTPAKRIEQVTAQNDNRFDEAFYSQLMDDVALDAISIEDAVKKASRNSY